MIAVDSEKMHIQGVNRGETAFRGGMHGNERRVDGEQQKKEPTRLGRLFEFPGGGNQIRTGE